MKCLEAPFSVSADEVLLFFILQCHFPVSILRFRYSCLLVHYTLSIVMTLSIYCSDSYLCEI